MKVFILALLIAVAVADDDKIIGGQIVSPGSVPYIVNLKRFGSLMCGGSILSSNYAMSAAHCNTAAASLTVTAGDFDLSSNDGTEQASSVRRTIPHPQYNSNTMEHDIMLLELSVTIREGTSVTYANLPTANVDPRVGTNCRVSGWGNTAIVGSNYPNKLYQVQVPVISNADCNAAYGGDIYDGMMCLGLLGTGGKDSCQGDSGGPVECNGAIHGVVSWGIGCAYPDYPGVYTRVSHYISFINQYV
uniref:Peptidase S1 domain-containing protein n=1 Tax=Ciona savignyi TaxID=51511 RepID=H2ZQN9_CIOSA